MPFATRLRVHGVILANPGLSVRSIAERIDVNESTASYHLWRLKQEDKVAPEARGREILWYPAGHGLCPVLRRTIPLLRDRLARDVARAFDESPLTVTEIFRRTGHSERRIRTALGQLQRAGIVERTPTGRVQLVEGARTCLRNAAEATPCALWGTCNVSAKWMRRIAESERDGANADRPRR